MKLGAVVVGGVCVGISAHIFLTHFNILNQCYSLERFQVDRKTGALDSAPHGGECAGPHPGPCAVPLRSREAGGRLGGAGRGSLTASAPQWPPLLENLSSIKLSESQSGKIGQEMYFSFRVMWSWMVSLRSFKEQAQEDDPGAAASRPRGAWLAWIRHRREVGQGQKPAPVRVPGTKLSHWSGVWRPVL